MCLGIPGKDNWEGKVYNLRMVFPDDYPFKPPQCRFTPPIFHPNVGIGGDVSLSLLTDSGSNHWSPSITIKTLLSCIQVLMCEPDTVNYVNVDAQKLLISNPKKYWRKLRKAARAP